MVGASGMVGDREISFEPASDWDVESRKASGADAHVASIEHVKTAVGVVGPGSDMTKSIRSFHVENARAVSDQPSGHFSFSADDLIKLF